MKRALTLLALVAGCGGDEVKLDQDGNPVTIGSLRVRTFGTAEMDDTAIASRLEQVIDFRLGGIVRDLNLKRLGEAR